jgi:predicted nucleic acid-binding protein
MTLVVDASVATLWTLETPLSSKAELVLRRDRNLIAPDFIIPEVTNALYIYLKSHPEGKLQIIDGIEFLPRWFSELVPAVGLRRRAFEIAVELEHPVYDCFYLALALSREVMFVSTDGHFLRKAAGKGYAGNVSHLEDW